MPKLTVASLIQKITELGYDDDSNENQLPWWIREYDLKVRQIGGGEMTSPVFISTSQSVNEGQPTSSPIEVPGEGSDWRKEGIESLAWYVPFHYGAKWGIYLRASGIELISSALSGIAKDRNEALNVARDFLMAHEKGHFIAEVIATTHEILGTQKFFVLGRQYISDHSDKKLVSDPRHSGHRWLCAAEGLCNALAAEALKKDFKKSLDSWLDASPAGYNDWRRHTKAFRAESWGEIVWAWKKGKALSRGEHQNEIEGLFFPDAMRLKSMFQEIPVYLVLDGSGPNREVAETIAGPISVRDTHALEKDFRKHHEAKKKWAKIRGQLQTGDFQNGANLKPIHGSKLKDVFRVKIDSAARVGLQLKNHELVAFIFDAQHDDFYVRLKAKDKIGE